MFEMQELSTSSSSDGEPLEQSEFEVPDTEIARALSQELPAPIKHSRWRVAVRGVGLSIVVVAIIAAFGLLLFGERTMYVEEKALQDELLQVEAFIQYAPEVELATESGDATLKMTDPPPK